MKSHGLAGLFEYVCALSQNRSNKIYPFSFENIQNSPPNPAMSWFDNAIQMTMPLGTLECFLVIVQLNGQRVNHSLYYRYMCSIGLSALPIQIIFHLLLT